jgi:hypothetical protein
VEFPPHLVSGNPNSEMIRRSFSPETGVFSSGLTPRRLVARLHPQEDADRGEAESGIFGQASEATMSYDRRAGV